MSNKSAVNHEATQEMVALLNEATVEGTMAINLEVTFFSTDEKVAFVVSSSVTGTSPGDEAWEDELAARLGKQVYEAVGQRVDAQLGEPIDAKVFSGYTTEDKSLAITDVQEYGKQA